MRVRTASDVTGQLVQFLGEQVGHNFRLSRTRPCVPCSRSIQPRTVWKNRSAAACRFDLVGGFSVAEDASRPRWPRAEKSWLSRYSTLALGELQAQMIGGDVFQRVRLVEDDDLVIGQKTRPLAPQGQVAEEQGVIDDEEVRPCMPLRALK